MTTPAQIAKGLRTFQKGSNWTDSSLNEHLKDLSWEDATRQVYDLNCIALLVHHMNYYLNAVFHVLKGNPLQSKHEESLQYPPIQSQQDWENLVQKNFQDAEDFATLIEQLTEEQLWKEFPDGRSGNYYYHIQGSIEHCYYHLGQIVVIKKILRQIPAK
jgi:uncharacterized damage-inducible protein DinB